MSDLLLLDPIFFILNVFEIPVILDKLKYSNSFDSDNKPFLDNIDDVRCKMAIISGEIKLEENKFKSKCEDKINALKQLKILLVKIHAYLKCNKKYIVLLETLNLNIDTNVKNIIEKEKCLSCIYIKRKDASSFKTTTIFREHNFNGGFNNHNSIMSELLLSKSNEIIIKIIYSLYNIMMIHLEDNKNEFKKKELIDERNKMRVLIEEIKEIINDNDYSNKNTSILECQHFFFKFILDILNLIVDSIFYQVWVILGIEKRSIVKFREKMIDNCVMIIKNHNIIDEFKKINMVKYISESVIRTYENYNVMDILNKEQSKTIKVEEELKYKIFFISIVLQKVNEQKIISYDENDIYFVMITLSFNNYHLFLKFIKENISDNENFEVSQMQLHDYLYEKISQYYPIKDSDDNFLLHPSENNYYELLKKRITITDNIDNGNQIYANIKFVLNDHNVINVNELVTINHTNEYLKKISSSLLFFLNRINKGNKIYKQCNDVDISSYINCLRKNNNNTKLLSKFRVTKNRYNTMFSLIQHDSGNVIWNAFYLMIFIKLFEMLYDNSVVRGYSNPRMQLLYESYSSFSHTNLIFLGIDKDLLEYRKKFKIFDKKTNVDMVTMYGGDSKIYEFCIQNPLYRYANEYEKEYDDVAALYMSYFIASWNDIIDKQKTKDTNNIVTNNNKTSVKKKVKIYTEQLISIDFD